MKFYKCVPRKVREMLEKELTEYKKSFTLTKEENRLLNEWVSFGNSPYENGSNLCTEYGQPLDFIGALRYEKEERKRYEEMTAEELEKAIAENVPVYNTEIDDIVLVRPMPDTIQCTDDELPF